MVRVTVVVPTYNRAHLITHTLDSILAQSFTDLEVVVVDDGSTDDTEAVVASYEARVRYLRRPHTGSTAATRNAGIEASESEFVAFVDSDDLWMPTKLERQIAYMEAHPECDLVFGDAIFIDQAGMPTRTDSTYLSWMRWNGDISFASMIVSNVIPSATPLVRRATLVQVGLFDPEIWYCEDHDLWLRIAATGTIAALDEVIASMRMGVGRKSDAPEKRLQRYQSEYLLLEKMRRVFPEQFPFGNSSVHCRLSEASLALGICEHDLGRRLNAFRLFIEALRHNPTAMRAYSRLVMLLLPRRGISALSSVRGTMRVV